jgi:hypothetical protein
MGEHSRRRRDERQREIDVVKNSNSACRGVTFPDARARGGRAPSERAAGTIDAVVDRPAI